MPKDRMPKIDDADVVHEFPLKDVALLRNALLAYEPLLAMDKLRADPVGGLNKTDDTDALAVSCL